MDNALERFFNKINFTNTSEFINTKVLKVVVNSKKETWDVYLSSPTVIKPEPLEELIKVFIFILGIPNLVNQLFSFFSLDLRSSDSILLITSILMVSSSKEILVSSKLTNEGFFFINLSKKILK